MCTRTKGKKINTRTGHSGVCILEPLIQLCLLDQNTLKTLCCFGVARGGEVKEVHAWTQLNSSVCLKETHPSKVTMFNPAISRAGS